MKKLISFCFFISCSLFVFAQDQGKPAPVKEQTQHATPKVTHKVAMKNFCCPSCDYVSPKSGTCPHHQKTLIRDGMFYCEDGTVSREAGKCTDGKDMLKMVDKTKRAKDQTPAPATMPSK